jgi:predicted DNA-binding transcriptional regulator AlpA
MTRLSLKSWAKQDYADWFDLRGGLPPETKGANLLQSSPMSATCIHNNDKPDSLLSRNSLAHRWGCSIETIKRREKDGTLKPIYLPGGRLVRYRLADVLDAEGGIR